jgi:hypothetical protein
MVNANEENQEKRGSKRVFHPNDWRRIHHSKLFWVGAILGLTAITIYVLSGDLSWRPWRR